MKISDKFCGMNQEKNRAKVFPVWPAGRLFQAAVLLAVAFVLPAPGANPSGGLRIEVMAAPNLVVDSNVESPSTYAPRCAYLGALFCNDSTNIMTNVYGYVGNYSGTTNTPGIYPTRAHPPLTGPLPGGEFSFTHEGDDLGTGDATRFIGTLQPGETEMVYWLIDYPNLDANGNSVAGGSKPDDDLWLEYDIWGTASRAGSNVVATTTNTATMRSEISAMANKIFPNGANKVPQEYLDLLQIYKPSWTNSAADGSPGTQIVLQGYWYDLGNIGAGFDNDGDLVPDCNAWFQPIGDPTLFDASSFRLVRTSAMVVVKLNDGTKQVYIDDDKLYFQNLPPNNRGAVGFIRYEFQVLRGGTTSVLSPYQEVASGRDTEKFNGDYGATLGEANNISSPTSRVVLVKDVDRAIATSGQTNTYTIAYSNAGTVAVGLPSASLPLVITDTIPTGTVYVAGSAAVSNVLPAGVGSYTVYYSTNSGGSWNSAEPAPAANVTDVQWWLSDPLPTGAWGSVQFKLQVKFPYLPPSPLLVNTGGLAIGNSYPFLTDTAETLITGTNRLGDQIWIDDGSGGGTFANQVKDGTETAISGAVVRLYYDLNTNGLYDGTDLFLTQQTTTSNGVYLFTNLPDARYVVVVDPAYTNIPAGYTLTTPGYYGEDLDSARTNANMVQVLTADFGFAPVLTMTKTLPTNTVYEAGNITYSIVVTNRLPGNGTGGGTPATYDVWSLTNLTQAKPWVNPGNVVGPPDGIYSSNALEAADEHLDVTRFNVGAQLGTVTSVVLRAQVSTLGTFVGGDYLTVGLYTNGNAGYIFSTNIPADLINGRTTNGVLSFNVSTRRAWSWTDFNSTNIAIEFIAQKAGTPNGGAAVYLDAAGFRVESDQLSPGANSANTLDPVPLYDYYNTNLLRYVSSSPPVSLSTNSGPTGTLYWVNLGPLYAGGSKTVTSTFSVLEPPLNTNSVVTNLAVITNALFVSGRPANTATSQVTTVVRPTGSIGDYVWRDINANGTQDVAEVGIANVFITLTPPAGVNLGNGPGAAITNTTDASGYYLFDGLISTGNYTVAVLTNTLPGAGIGTTNTFDWDRNRNNSTTVSNFNSYATNGLDEIRYVDFGYWVRTTIEGTIWHDYNRNGTNYADAGEEYLTNVTVYLYSSTNLVTPIATNTTGTGGYYQFFGSYTGSYVVVVATNTGVMTSSTWVQSFDTDGLATTNRATVTVVLGGYGRADFSYYRTNSFSLGDTVFYDMDGNGVQSNSFEEGIRNITVSLYEDNNSNGVVDVATDAFIRSTSTDTNGYYLFTGLFTNTYLVIVDQSDPDFPANVIPTADPWGALDGRSVVYLTATNLAQDFGYQPYGSSVIGDTVWRDVNGDGLKSGTGETGISNIMVRLYADINGDGNYILLRTTNTSSSGTYEFTALPARSYRVSVDTLDNDLPNDSFGNNYLPTTATNYTVVLTNGQSSLTNDFGFVALGAIGDTIFWDANANGTQDYNEGGIPGITVNLYTNGTLVASTVTTNGEYLFTGLRPATYTVSVVYTGALLGTYISADPDSNGYPYDDPLSAGYDGQATLTLGLSQNFVGADFGYIPPGGSIGDLLWTDFNGNGQFNSGESGIPYVSVILYSNNTAIATNETDADGYYIFYGLSNGTYRVAVATNDVDFPPGLTQTYDRDGTIDNQATNIVITGGTVVKVGGTPCTNGNLTIDFGYRYLGTNQLSGTIGLDDPSKDGVLNGTNTSGVATNETAFNGITVYAYLWRDDGDKVVESGETLLVNMTETGINGDYTFTNLPASSLTNYYIVSMAAPISGLDLTTTTNSTHSTVLVETLDLQGDTVSAYQAVPVAPGTTGLDFAFVSLASMDFGDLPNTYSTLLLNGARHIVKTVPDLYLGTNVTTESNGQPSTGADTDGGDTGVFVAGIWQNGASGGAAQVKVGAGSGWLVGFIDFSRDGTFNAANEMVFSQSVSTNGGPSTNGIYSLPFNVPDGALSLTNTTVLYSRFRLFPSVPLFPVLSYQGEASNGEVEDYRWVFNVIGGTVYMDSDTNSAFSGGDSRLAGVVVRLYDASSNLLASTVSGTNGYYNFIGLSNGSYRVEMTVPTNAAAILDVDGSANGNNLIAVTLSGSSSLGRDFLLNTNATRAAVSGTVYEDDGFAVNPGNGSFGTNDVPVPGVIVSLYRDINGDGIAALSEFIGSAITDVSGNYTFSNLPNGNYLTVMTTPSGATSVTDTDGNGNGTNLIQVPLTGANVTGRNFLVDGAKYAALSGLVWYDVNRNHIRGLTETNYFAGIPVYLYDANTNVIGSTTTAANGTYSFTNILPAACFVGFNLTTVDPALVIATANQGTNTARNSDVVSGSVGVYGYTALMNLLSGGDVQNIDLGLQPEAATRADVAQVRGEWRNGIGYIVWQTGSEWGTAGFFVYRVDSDTGAETLLNNLLVPSAFSAAGAVYEQVDPQAVENGKAVYRLEEVEITGALRDLDTHEVQFTQPRPVAMAAPLALAAESVASSSEIAVQETSSVLKVLVRKEGIYGVSLQSIADGMGRALSDIQTLAEAGSLQIAAQGEQVPFWFDGVRARLLFYGKPSTNWYARDAAYLISEGTGRAMTKRAPDASSGDTVFPTQLRFEQDRYPLEAALTRPADFYYWDYIISGNAVTGQRDFNLDLSGFAGESLELTVRLQGWSSTDNNPDHMAEFLWNGNPAGLVFFDGQDVTDAVLTISGTAVQNGTNTLTVKGVLQPGYSHSFFVVDRIDAAFSRTLAPRAGTARFRAGGSAAVSAAGFTSPLAVALNEEGVPVRIADENGELPSKAWNAFGTNEQFAVIEAENVPMLGTQPAAADAWFLAANNRVDYLVITSRALAPSAQALADYRTGQGLRTGVAVFEDVCDLMTHGLRTPEAIPELLRYAKTTWTESPWMVVLAGNGHYDYLGALSNEVNQLPPLLLDTQDGLFAADGLLSDLNGDGLPDVPVGRLPAITAADLTAMIDKIKAYEAGFGTAWQNGLVFAADTNDAAGNFSAVNARLAALGGVNYPAEQIDLNTTAFTAARNRLLTCLKGGEGFVHYTGHGGVSSWSSKNLLIASDVSTMTNATRPSVVVALSCLVGRYESPAVQGMGELLLRKAGGGAVAVWSPSGLSRNTPAAELGEAFYRAVLEEGSGTLGLAILQARRSLPGDLFTRDTFATYNLLGDPALRIAGNVGGQPSDTGFAQWRWQRFTPVELADAQFSGALADANGNGQNNILEYALGGSPVVGSSVIANLEIDQGNNTGAVVRWKQRRLSPDLQYRISASTDLTTWEAETSSMQILSTLPDADGVMETVTAQLASPADRLFVRLDVIQK